MRHEQYDRQDDKWNSITGLGIPRYDGVGDAEGGPVFAPVEDHQHRVGAGLVDIQEIGIDDSVCCYEAEKI